MNGTRRPGLWRDRAACLPAGTPWLWDFDIDLPGHHGGEPDNARNDRWVHAKAICRSCPVIDQCAREGLASFGWGVWAGQVLRDGQPYSPARPGRKPAA